MKISDRDKKIIYVVVAVLIVAAAFFFGYRNISEANEKLTKEIATKNTTYNNLRIMEAQAGTYAEDTEKYISNYSIDLDHYAADKSQPYIISNLINIENANQTWISQAALSEAEQIFTFGQIPSTNPSGAVATVYSTDYEGYATKSTLTYQMSYENFKNTINYINTFMYKYTIDSISASYNSETDRVSGNMVLTQYAITGDDRKSNIFINNNATGTNNVFNSGTFTPGSESNLANGNYVVSDYDYYMVLQGEDSTIGNVVVGQKIDMSGDTVITATENELVPVTLRFFQDENGYYAQYSIGDQQFPATDFDEGQNFIPGNYLSVLVQSSARTESGDASGALVTIVNDTDMTLDVKVINEDEKDPRFNIKETRGDVNVYR